jgi:hypothetical protein
MNGSKTKKKNVPKNTFNKQLGFLPHIFQTVSTRKTATVVTSTATVTATASKKTATDFYFQPQR